jgi:hypothetical protein
MAKQSGLGDNFYVDGFDLSGDIGQIGPVHGGPAALLTTGIDKSAQERIGGRRDGGMTWRAFFDKQAAQAHPVLSALPTTDRVATYCRGTVLGNAAASSVCKQVGYDGQRDDSGSFLLTVAGVSNQYGLEWGRLLTAGKRSDTTPTNGTGVDFLAASSFGLQAYLHVSSFTGTSVTVALQESSDNGGGDAFTAVTGGAFAAASAIGAQRIATASGLAVERYLRVVTTGTFTQATFAVIVMRNDTAVSF